MKLSEWILRSREERTAHIDLSTPCEFDAPVRNKHILLNHLSIDDDCPNWTEAKIHRCHLCSCGRRKGGCVNPKHFYFGTASENQLDTNPEWRKQRSRKCGTASKGTHPKLDRVIASLPQVEGLSSRKAAEILGVTHHTVLRARRVYFAKKKT